MNITDRAKNILLTPEKEWSVVATEPADTNKLITGYAVPLAALAALAAFIGYGLITTGGSVKLGLYYAINVFLTGLVSVYVTALVIDMLAPSFDAEKNFGRSLQLVTYSFTPIWIGGLLTLFPPLAIVGLLVGLYGLYLMYIGLAKLKSAPADKVTGYFVVSILVTIVVYIVIGIIMVRLLASIFGFTVIGGIF